MYEDSLTDISDAAAAQVELIKKSLPAYLVHSGMAGVYIAFAVVMTFIFGQSLYQTVFEPVRGIVMAAVFGIALSLVIVAGSELFTGNAMIMSVGALTDRTTWSDLGTVWSVSWIGNLMGSMLIVGLAFLAGVFPDGSLLASVGSYKMNAPAIELFTRAILCNWLVVLAVWSNFQLENPVAKLIMVWWCLLAFVGSGFEHSIANMSILGLANVVVPGAAGVSWQGMAYNLTIVTAGNIVSGVVCMGAAYYYVTSSYGYSWNWGLEDTSTQTGNVVVSDDD
ncbi:formate/nitrite transporter family protein [Natronoarchaeum mannanilyticum]|uniref:Formate/nitrite transporter family protein n=1 Tax=Natronoarchaeum mannanilyticum TaxID=926360 RepID=A0AAV3T7K7_9EURY